MTTLETRLSKLEATQPAVKGYKTFVVDDSADGDGLRRVNYTDQKAVS